MIGNSQIKVKLRLSGRTNDLLIDGITAITHRACRLVWVSIQNREQLTLQANSVAPTP